MFNEHMIISSTLSQCWS